MIFKEWRDARWKVLLAAVPVVLLVFLLSPYAEFVEEARRIPGEDPAENALRDVNDLYYLGGFFVLLPLAAFLGVASISGEVSSNTVLLYLSRPTSRTRLLFTKYAVCAGALLVAAALGKVLIVGVAVARGYPVERLGTLEMLLSVVVLWLGVLFVLGMAFLMSVIFRDVIVSIVACACTLFLVFALPMIVAEYYPWGHTYEMSSRLTLLTYWMPTSYYYGDGFYEIGGFAITNFLVCLVAAAVPILVALRVFQRKEF